MGNRPLFYTADTHWGHRNIIKYCERPFADVEEMNEYLIEAWNKKVPKDGIVYHLGDVSFMKSEATGNIVRRLNGQIFLVLGNHDEHLKAETRKLFAWTKDRHGMTVPTPEGKKKLVLDHYPILSWNGMHKGSWNLHGHCHGKVKPFPGRMDVGVDCHPDLVPFSLAEVCEYMSINKGS